MAENNQYYKAENNTKIILDLINSISDYKEQRLTANEIIFALINEISLNRFDAIAMLEAVKNQYIKIADKVESNQQDDDDYNQDDD